MRRQQRALLRDDGLMARLQRRDWYIRRDCIHDAMMMMMTGRQLLAIAGLLLCVCNSYKSQSKRQPAEALWVIRSWGTTVGGSTREMRRRFTQHPPPLLVALRSAS